METLDTHDIELAFYDLMQELNKIKSLNSIAGSYKENLDNYSKIIDELLEVVKDSSEKDKANVLLVCRKYSEYQEKAEKLDLGLRTAISDFESHMLECSRDNKKQYEDNIARMSKLLTDENAAFQAQAEKLDSGLRTAISNFESQALASIRVNKNQNDEHIARMTKLLTDGTLVFNGILDGFTKMSKRNNIISIIIASVSICVYVGLAIFILLR